MSFETGVVPFWVDMNAVRIAAPRPRRLVCAVQQELLGEGNGLTVNQIASRHSPLPALGHRVTHVTHID
jgi:hypothetical protein